VDSLSVWRLLLACEVAMAQTVQFRIQQLLFASNAYVCVARGYVHLEVDRKHRYHSVNTCRAHHTSQVAGARAASSRLVAVCTSCWPLVLLAPTTLDPACKQQLLP
jgi:hypothetical protein